MARAHGVLFALVVGCGGPVRHPGEEFIEAIRFEGNQAISSDDLRRGLALRRAQEQGAVPDPYLVSVDRERIAGAYLRLGYFDVDIQSHVERRGDAATVTYRIAEGTRARTRIAISGLPNDPELTEASVRKHLPLHDGDPFVYDTYDQAKEALLTVVEDAGYARAHLDAKVLADRASHEAVVQLAYEVGPKCRFGTIDILGAPEGLLDSARARMEVATGDQYSATALAKSQRALYAMHRFSTVRVTPDKGESEVVNVRVTLAEGAPHEVSLGGGFGIDPATYEVRGRAGYTQIGWPWPLTNLEIDTRPAYAFLRDGTGSQPRIRALAKLTRIDLFYPRVDGSIEGGYDYLIVEAYTMFGPHIGLGLASPLGIPELRARVGWLLQRYDFRDLSPVVGPIEAQRLGLDSTERLGEYQQSIVLDLRDNPLEPRLGMYADLRVNEGTPYAGGALSFLQVTPEVRGYTPLGGNLVLAARVRVGNFFGDLPVSERYYSGGATTQRGFSERRLAPTLFGFVNNEPASEPIGGGGLVESNLEVRARLGKIKGMPVGGVVFLDGGDVKESFGDITLSSLNWAAGGGLRVYTVLGAVRLDVGYRLNHTGPLEPEPNSHYAFHLSLGEAY